MKSLLAGLLLLAAAAPVGDPLLPVRRVQGKTMVQCTGALETVMLLAQLAGGGKGATEFQAQARSRFALRSNHPAVQETAALLKQGFSYRELAIFATLISQAPYFTLQETAEVKELAARLPGPDKEFNMDRLFGYSRLVHDFYWDTRLGTFLRAELPVYREALRHSLPADLPAEAHVLISPLAPVERVEFSRQLPVPATYVVLGEPVGR
jgi:hypothetical protein